MGEQPEPGGTRWRKADDVVKTAAPADERLGSPPPPNRGQTLLLPEEVVDVLLFKVTEKEASQVWVFVHAASPDVLTGRTHLKLLGLW